MGTGNDGSATAELAVLLPLLSVVIWIASAIGNAQLAQASNLNAAATLVRAIQLGYPEGELDSVAQGLGVDCDLVDMGDGLICVDAGSYRRGVLFASDAKQRSCGVVPAR